MSNIQKCAIIGCGFVGSTTAFALMKSGLFSELVLLDANQQKAEGEAMDLNHGLPFAKPMRVYAGDYADLKDCALVIITAGTGQTQGQTRMDLVHENIKIFESIIPRITHYNSDCILLILSNPVDILTYVSIQLSGFPAHRVLGSGTVLDTARFKHLLGEHLHVDSRNVHAFIIGEHGDSELPVWSSANVSGIDLKGFCNSSNSCDQQELLEAMHQIPQQVIQSAYQVIRRKKATYYGIAMAVLRIVEAIVRDEHSVLSVSTLTEGHYGLSDVCLGIPAIVGKSGIEQVLDIPLNEQEQKNLENSARMLREVLDECNLEKKS